MNHSKNAKSPIRSELLIDSNSNSAQSSPETHLSSACLLVQAAVEPMEPGFKFPKTKKGLMNEWLNKVPEPIQSASSISPSSLTPHITVNNHDYDGGSNLNFYTGQSVVTATAATAGVSINNNNNKSLAALAQVASFCDTNLQHPRGSAKKRWLRQAISEDNSQSDNNNLLLLSRPGNNNIFLWFLWDYFDYCFLRVLESPPLSETVAPPKKRRLPRESISSDITPPTTPTSLVPPQLIIHNNQIDRQENCLDICTSNSNGGIDDNNDIINNSSSSSSSSNPIQQRTIIDLDNNNVTATITTPVVAEDDDDIDDDEDDDDNNDDMIINNKESVEESHDLTIISSSSTTLTSTLSSVTTPTTATTISGLMDPRLSRDLHHHIFTSSNSDHLVGTVEKTLSIFGFEDRKPEPVKRKVNYIVFYYI